MDSRILLLLLTGIFIGAAAGYIGSFMVLKRMSLVGDALSHVALPGMAVALVFHFSPILGAFCALTIALFGVWYFENTTKIYPEALVGIFFTTSLALGLLLTPQPDLLEALFGNIQKITVFDGVIVIILSVLIMFITMLISKKLILGTISEELAKSLKISISRINLVYLLVVGTVVALGVTFIGTLLMGALVIIPAVSARNISTSLNSYYIYSILFGISSAFLGILISEYLNIASGPIVVLINVGIFLTTYLVKKIRS